MPACGSSPFPSNHSDSKSLATYIENRALKADEAALGPSDKETLTSVFQLALALEGSQRFNEALPLYRRALAGHEATLGPVHPTTLVR